MNTMIHNKHENKSICKLHVAHYAIAIIQMCIRRLIHTYMYMQPKGRVRTNVDEPQLGYQIHRTLTSTDRHHQVVMQTEIGSIIIALCDNLYTVVRLLLFHVVYINTTVTRGSPYRKTTIIYVLVYGNKPTDCCIFRRDLQHSWVAIMNQRWLKQR